MQLTTPVETFLNNKEQVLAIPNGQATREVTLPRDAALERLIPQLSDSFAANLSLIRKPKRRFPTKRRLVDVFAKDHDRLADIERQLDNFLHDCIFSTLVPASREPHLTQALVDITERLATETKSPLLPQTLETRADIISQFNVNELQGHFTNSLRESSHALSRNFFTVLQRGADNFIFGRLQTFNEERLDIAHPCSAARYWYPTRLVDTGSTNSVRAVALHVHDVVDSTLTPLPARSVPKPRWVWPLTAAVPKCLKRVPGAVAVLQGDLTLEQVFVQGNSMNAEERVRRAPMWIDPALVIGPYVLTGWNPTDLRVGGMRRQWTPSFMPEAPKWHQKSWPVWWKRFLDA